jgi:hypothetical protein
MEMQKQQALSKKVVRTLLAMSFVYSGGMFVAGEADAAPTFATPVKTIDCDSAFTNSEAITITAADFAAKSADVGLTLDMKTYYNRDYVFNGDVNIDAGTGGTALYVNNHATSASSSNGGHISLNGNVTLKAALGNYAIYVDDIGCGAADRSSLKINTDGTKTVQIEGKIRNINYGDGVSLNLANPQSYWAGDRDTQRSSQINLKLSNSAVWYPSLDEHKYDLYINSDGGIIDIYHKRPGEARDDTSRGRVFKIDNIRSSGHQLKNTTFRIGSNIEAGWSDKIVLIGTDTVSGNNTQYIQIVADPSLKSSNASMDLAAKKIVVAQVDGIYLTKDNTSFAGQKYEGAEVDAGLTLADVTPELEYDSSVDSNKGGWIIKNVTAENFRAASVDGEKGSALTATSIPRCSAFMAVMWAIKGILPI